MLAQSNGRIKNYDCCREPGLLRILRQNPNLTWVISQGWTVSFPPSSRRFTLESCIGLVATSVASCLSLQNSLIANTFLQQHCIEVVTDKNFK